MLLVGWFFPLAVPSPYLLVQFCNSLATVCPATNPYLADTASVLPAIVPFLVLYVDFKS